MAPASPVDSIRRYSWLWDSHISPKNSKWLQENLTDIDNTVKQMIKIIEEDGESFASRAEMYYKRRPELMRLVEQFYRAYRGLAERYSHATVVIRQAHHTMAEAFPDQVPPLLTDDSPSKATADAKIPDMIFSAEDASPRRARKIFKLLLEMEDSAVQNGLCSLDMFEFGSEDLHEADALELKEAVSEQESEKEVGLAQFQKILERLSALESQVVCAEEESRGLKERANKAEDVIKSLNEALRRSEVEHEECPGIISELQNKLLKAEDDAWRISERASKADREIGRLKIVIEKVDEEKEAASLIYWQSIEKISSLELKFLATQEEVCRLNRDISAAMVKLQGAEEQHLLLEKSKQHLETEMHLLVQEMESRRQELLEKQTEIGRIWATVQEEHLRFLGAETAFQKLQLLHSQSQEQLQSLSLKLQSKDQVVNEMEACSQSLEDEKLTLEIENVVLLSLLESVTYEADKISLKNSHLESCLRTLDLEEQVSSSQIKDLVSQRIYKESESSICRVEKLLALIDVSKRESSGRTKLYETHLARLESQLCILQEEKQKMKNETEEAADGIVKAETENVILLKTLEDLAGKNQKLRMGMNQVSRILMTDEDLGYEDESVLDETHVRLLLHKLENLRSKLRQTLDSNELLVLEKSVLVMLFGQLRMEAAEAETERCALLQNLNNQSQRLTEMQNKADNLEQMNRLLRQTEDENEAVNGRIFELQGAYQNLETQNAKVLEENISLKKDLLELKRRNRALEDENCMVLVEALSSSNISLVFKNFVAEKTLEVAKLGDRLHELNGVMNEKHSQLHETQLSLLLVQKEKALLEKTLEDVRRGCNQVKENQEKQMLKLSQDNEREITNNTFLQKTVKQLEAEVSVLREQCDETKARARTMSSELEEGRNKTILRDTQAEALFGELLKSSVEEAVFIEKVHELTEECRRLESKRNAEAVAFQKLNGNVSHLEGENAELKSQLHEFTSAVDSLRDSVASLESHFILREKFLNWTAENSEVAGFVYSVHDTDNRNQNAEFLRGLAEVQRMQTRIKAIERTVEEMERVATSDNLDTDIKREVLPSVPSDEESKSVSNSPVEQSVHKIKQFTSQHSAYDALKDAPGDDLGRRKPEMDDLDIVCDMSKDIALDQTSRQAHYGSSTKGSVTQDDRMLELWEMDNEDRSIALTVTKSSGKTDSFSEIVAVKDESEVIDKLEVSKSAVDSSHHVDNKRKILDKLESDGKKLANLQITVQDLKTKVETTDKTNRDHDIEYNTVKEQLDEAEESITKLSETNAKLKKALEDERPDKAVSARRKKILEHAQRGAERISRLHLEVQKLQFLLLKLDKEKEKPKSALVTDPKPKVLLKDYLRGRTKSVTFKSSQNQGKKPRFCACIRPPTMGD